ncbi:MAG: low molecular weight protein-tyrosine-phosphatase [Cytophagales bacterium]|nr:low molecular weight protein-tyrosine-phosphatase [Cytophagales bacterium]
MKKTKILFVCLGNICRSPMAEGILHKILTERGLTNAIIADSAGTANYHIGDPPDHRTLQILKKHGIDTSHKGRQITDKDFVEFDHILVMDHDNYYHVMALARSHTDRQKVTYAREYDADAPSKIVPDPYYGTIQDFEEVYNMLYISLNKFVDSIALS